MPEWSRSFGSLLTLDATYFYNRYYDLIVTLGGSLATLSHYQSANLANSQAQGAEFSARLRPARWVLITGSYTLLETRILSLDGSSNQAPLPYRRGAAVDAPSRELRECGGYIHPRTAGRRPLRLLSRPHALRRAELRRQQRIILESWIRQRRCQRELHASVAE